MQQAVKREDAAFAVAIGAQHKSRVFAAYNKRQRPKNERDATENVVGRNWNVGWAVKNLIDGVKRRGADVPEDHSDCANRQGGLGAMRLVAQFRRDGAIEHGYTRAPDQRRSYRSPSASGVSLTLPHLLKKEGSWMESQQAERASCIIAYSCAFCQSFSERTAPLCIVYGFRSAVHWSRRDNIAS